VRRPAAVLATVSTLTVAGLLVAGCSGEALSQAEQACVHVNKSISLYEQSLQNPDATHAAAQRTQAEAQLELAEPLAAAANSSDGTWNGLMTTIGEVSRVSESELVDALRSQCNAVAVAASNAPPKTTGPTAPTGGSGSSVPSTVLPGHAPTSQPAR
jgi:hypothetical protein